MAVAVEKVFYFWHKAKVYYLFHILFLFYKNWNFQIGDRKKDRCIIYHNFA